MIRVARPKRWKLLEIMFATWLGSFAAFVFGQDTLHGVDPPEYTTQDGISIWGSVRYQTRVSIVLELLRVRDHESDGILKRNLRSICETPIVARQAQDPIALIDAPSALGSLTWCASMLSMKGLESQFIGEMNPNPGRYQSRPTQIGRLKKLKCYEQGLKTLRLVGAQESEIQHFSRSVENQYRFIETLVVGPGINDEQRTVMVRGSVEFVNCVLDALKVLDERDCRMAAYVREYIGKIEQAEPLGMRADEDPPALGFTKRMACRSPTFCAATLIHEACHSQKYHDWKARHGEPVPYEAAGGRENELDCNKLAIASLIMMGAPQDEIEHIRGDDGWHSDFDRDGIVTNEEYAEWTRLNRD